MKAFSDENLMQQVSLGDVSKLGMLFERHHRQLYNFFFRQTRKAEHSEDLVQEVFCRILKYRHSYTQAQPFMPWFFRIAHNVGIDHFKAASPEAQMDEFLEPASPVNQDKALDDRQELAKLEKALQKLSVDKRELVILCRFHNLKYKQIAQLLNCSVSAIKVRLHRALKELSEGYQQSTKGVAP